MIDERFSRERFEKPGLDSPALKRLLKTMGAEFLQELSDGLRPSVDSLGEQLQGLGYQLELSVELASTGHSVCFDFRDREDTLVVAIDISVCCDLQIISSP